MSCVSCHSGFNPFCYGDCCVHTLDISRRQLKKKKCYSYASFFYVIFPLFEPFNSFIFCFSYHSQVICSRSSDPNMSYMTGFKTEHWLVMIRDSVAVWAFCC